MKIRLAKVSDIKQGEIKTFEYDGESIAICNVEGNFYAFLDSCTHMEFPLSGGKLDGEVITCPAHGARFNVRSGEALSMPAVTPLKKFSTMVNGDDIYIEVD